MGVFLVRSDREKLARYGLTATVRASLALYNTRSEIDRLAAAVEKVSEIFA